MNTSHLETLQNLATFTSVWSLQTSNPAPMFLQYQMIYQKMNCSKVCLILDLKMIKDSEFSHFFPLQHPWRAVLFLKCCRGGHLNQSYDTGKAWKSGKTTMDGKELGCNKKSRNTWAKYWSFHFLVVVNKPFMCLDAPWALGLQLCAAVSLVCVDQRTLAWRMCSGNRAFLSLCFNPWKLAHSVLTGPRMFKTVHTWFYNYSTYIRDFITTIYMWFYN